MVSTKLLRVFSVGPSLEKIISVGEINKISLPCSPLTARSKNVVFLDSVNLFAFLL